MKTEFDHIAITSKNIADSIAFYKKQFAGVEVLYQDESWGLLKVGGIKLALVTETEHPPHICFRAETKAELQEYAEKNGAKIIGHRDRSQSFYFYDTSGNAVEVVWYPEDY